MGYTTSTVHGIEVPNSAEANDVPEDIGKVVTALEGGSIIRRLTGAQIAALTVPQKPAGLVVYNTTTGTLQISDGTNVADLADATKLPLAGGTMSGPIAMGASKVTGLGDGTAPADAVNKAQLDAKLNLAGGTMTGDITMTNNQITNLTKLRGPTTSADLKIHVPYGGQVDIQGGAGTPATGTIAHANATFANQSATLGQIPSSRAVKQDIAALTAEQADAFDAITPVQFRYRDGVAPNEVEQEGVHLGFIAEDVKAAGVRVLEDPDGVVFGLQPFELIAVLWAKVQDLQQRLSDLEG